jgi:protein ImuB
LVAVEDHRPERASALCEARSVGAASSAGGGKKRQRSPAAAVAADLQAPPSSSERAARPVWLQAAEPLLERATRPLLDGRPLQLLSGPERIEAGWWDAGLAGRDYFIAATAEGALVWIYRERLPLSRSANEEEEGSASGWFLHGRFG